MRPAFWIACALFGLTACTEFTTFYQPGKTKTDRNVDQAQCNRSAADQYPPRIITEWWPVYNSEGRFLGHRFEQFDQNEGARHTAARACMTERGYQRVKIPYCKDEQIEGRQFAKIEAAPAFSPSICGIRTKGSDPVLIDLSKPL